MYSQIMTLTQENGCGNRGNKRYRLRDRLKQSADTAGAQLEWLKPSLMGGQRGGFYAGPAVMDSPGTVLIVLAHNKKAFTMHLFPRLLSREGAPSPSRGHTGGLWASLNGPGQGGSGEWQGALSGHGWGAVSPMGP